MITQVSSRGFKGQDFDQDLERLNLVIGKNGAGKSARSMALILAAKGDVPGVAKTNPEIFSTFAPHDADKFNVTVKIGKRPFLRRFKKTAKGSISQDYMVDRKKAKKDDFLSAMAEAGKPAIIDLGAFLDLSNAKKIEWLFDLYPPGEGLEEIEQEIADAREKVNATRKAFGDKERLIQSLTESRSEIELPAGTMAEVDAELQKVRGEYAEVNAQIREIETKGREEAAAEKAKKEAEEKAKQEAEAKERQAEAKKAAPAPSTPDVPPEIQDKPAAQAAVDRMKRRDPNIGNHPDPYESITAIIETMDRVGCSACAARLIALRERNKHPAAGAGERTGTNG